MVVLESCRRGQEHALFLRYRRTGERALRDALVERHLPLALGLARRYRAGSEREDVEQVACLALVKAVERFDPGKGVAFSSFATPTILGEIKRYFRDHGWVVRVPREVQERSLAIERARERMGREATAAELASALGIGLEDVLEALASATAHRPAHLEPTDKATLVERGFGEVEDAVAVDSLLDRLPALERSVVELRFREDLLQREIAELLGTSQMQVSRVLSRALAELQRVYAEPAPG
jgi:RNA polymerase sigma-B factor